MPLTKPQIAALEALLDGPRADLNVTVAKNLYNACLIDIVGEGGVDHPVYEISHNGRTALGLMTESEAEFAGLVEREDAATIAAELPAVEELQARGARVWESTTADEPVDAVPAGFVDVDYTSEKRVKLLQGERFRIEDSEAPKNHQQSAYGVSMLFGLDAGKHIYGGTANAGKVNKRRAKNRVARKARKGNRRG